MGKDDEKNFKRNFVKHCPHADGRILEVGAGTGRITKIIHEVTKCRVDVIEKNPQWSAHMKKWTEICDKVYTGDARDIKTIIEETDKRSFATVVIVGVTQYLDDKDFCQLLKDIREVVLR